VSDNPAPDREDDQGPAASEDGEMRQTPEPDESSSPPATTPSDDTATGVRTENICFEVTIPKDPLRLPVAVAGTLFLPSRGPTPGTAVILAPGHSTPRDAWDGSPAGFGVANETTPARALARAGYAVFTFDRPGIGDTPYEGEGREGGQLDYEANLKVFGDVVAAVRQGAYRVSDPACPSVIPTGIGFAKIVLGGHSLSTFMVATYAERKDDVDGLLLTSAHHYGVNGAIADHVAYCNARHPPSRGFQRYTCDDDTPPNVHSCEDVFFYSPGARPDVAEALCARMEVDSAVVFPEAQTVENARFKQELANIGDIPVLLVIGDRDCAFKFGPECDDATGQENEIRDWQSSCSCRFAFYEPPETGHFWMLHDSVEETNAVILNWLRAGGF